jgi:hypothetical protein
MSKMVTMWCPRDADVPSIHIEAGRVFWNWDHGQKTQQIRAQLLDRFTAIVDDATLLSFVRRFGFVQPMHARNPDDANGFHSEPTAPAIRQAAQFREIRQSPRSAWGAREFTRAAAYLQDIVVYCRLSPSIDYDKELLTLGVGITDLPDAPFDTRLPLTCALSAALHFLLDEFRHGQRSDAPKVRLRDVVCANPECRKRFPARRRPVAGGRSWCDNCRGSPDMWRAIKQDQRQRQQPLSRAPA